MNHATEEAIFRRVLLVVEPPGIAPEPFAAMRRLAEELRAELAGLFVEDLNLLRLAALPITRETGLVSGAVRPIDVSDVERAMRLQAEQLRQRLSALAAELQLPWSFQVARGSLLEQALEMAPPADLVVLGGRRRSARAAVMTPSEQIVSALFDASETGFRVLKAALQLAEGRPERLMLLVPAAPEMSLEEIRRAAAERLGVTAEFPRALLVSATELQELSQQARRRHCSALVVATHSLLDARTQIRALLEALECPLVLVT